MTILRSEVEKFWALVVYLKEVRNMPQNHSHAVVNPIAWSLKLAKQKDFLVQSFAI